MEELEAKFQGTTVFVGNTSWQVPWPVRQAIVHGDYVLVLYDPMAKAVNESFPNLEGFTVHGKKLWTAQPPLDHAPDSYLLISAGADLTRFSARTWSSYICRLETQTGRVVEKELER